MNDVDAFPVPNLGPVLKNTDQPSNRPQVPTDPGANPQAQQNNRVPDPFETTDEVGKPATNSDGEVLGLDYRDAFANHDYQTPLYHARPAGGTLADPTRAS